MIVPTISAHRSYRFLAWICLMIGLFTASSVEATRLPSPNRECSACHIMWLTEFKRDDVTPLIPYEPQPVLKTGKQDVSSTPRMCFSCHDGFVLDSRFMWKEGHRDHPIGQKPSDKIRIPTEDGKQQFPLNHDGRVYCGTCHTAHGVDWKTRDSAVFMRVRSVDGKLCEACHQDKTTGPETGTHPTHTKPDTFPDVLKKAGSKLSTKGNVICQSCHRPHAAADDKILVMQNGNSELCGTCHADRYPRDPAEAGQMGTHPVNARNPDIQVPDVLLENGARLGKNGVVICQTCHTPHAAATNKKLLVHNNDDSALCMECHIKQRTVVDSKHNMKLVDRSLSNIKQQTVGKQGVCSACHIAHGGTAPKMWARDIKPDADDPMAEACLSCHSNEGIAEAYQVGHFTHPVGRPMSKLPEAVNLPGYTRSGVKSVHAKAGSVTCASCHDPHQWNPRDKTETSRPGDKGDAGNSFLRIANKTGSVLCLTCHKDKPTIKGSKHDMTVMAPDDRNIKGQLPLIAGICSACHVPHNGTGSAMWSRQPGNADDPVSSTCLSCHNARGLAHEKLVGTHSHPVGVPILDVGIQAINDTWVSRFQGIDGLKPIQALPLFNAQGQTTDTDGMVTCASCHDPHKWTPHGQLANSAHPQELEGDQNSSFLRLTNDENSSLCVNCHRAESAISLSKHNLEISAPQTANADGLTVTEGGPCSACHIPHNGHDMKMWSRIGVDKKEGVSGLCISCHSKDNPAENKIVISDGHPVHEPLGKATASNILPLFDTDGTRNSDLGLIECATCHNTHQWDPMDAASKAGAQAEVEGGPDTSFLRLPSVAQHGKLCRECHN